MSEVETLYLTKNVVVLYVQIPTIGNVPALDLDIVHKRVKKYDELYGEQFRAAGFTVIAVPDTCTVEMTESTESRQVFHIDVGNMPKSRVEEYLKNMMATFKKTHPNEQVIILPKRD